MKSRSILRLFFLLPTCVLFCLVSQSTLAQNNATRAQRAKKVIFVPIQSGVARLSPENTKIEFVGTHVGDDPKPRLGGFEKFSGTIEVEVSTIKSINVEFDVTSIWTQFPKLTGHLKTADFFDVEKFPKSTFQSTEIKQTSGGTTVVGTLTMLGASKEISFPVRLTIFDGALSLTSEFKMDRTDWGMDKMTEGVHNDVSIKVVVGEKTNPQTASGSGFNVQAFFKENDKNGDGKLTGSEIPDRIKQNLGDIDADKDGAVTLEEIQKLMSSRRGR